MGGKIPPRRSRRPKPVPSTIVSRRSQTTVGERRLRSKTVVVGALGALFVGGGVALAMSEDRHCVNTQQQVVDDGYCHRGGVGYRWYYGGRVGGGKVSGGSYERGGFGRFFGGYHGG